MSFEVIRNGITGMCVTAQGDYFCRDSINGQLFYLPPGSDEETIREQDHQASEDYAHLVLPLHDNQQCTDSLIKDFVCSFHFPACKKAGEPDPVGMCKNVCQEFGKYCLSDVAPVCDKGGRFVDHKGESSRECSGAPSGKRSQGALIVILTGLAMTVFATTFV